MSMRGMPGDPQMQVLLEKVNNQSAFIRQLAQRTDAAEAAAQKAQSELAGMRQVLQRVQIGSSGGGGGRLNAPMGRNGQNEWVDFEKIPGRRVPYDFHTTILIKDGEVQEQQGNLYVTPDGLYVATARYAIFQSFLEFQNSTGARFSGRSYGRFRPIHSANDIMDAQRAFEQLSQYQPSFLGAVVSADGAGPAAGNIVPVANPAGVHPAGGAIYGASADTTNMLPNFPGNGVPLWPSPLAMAAFRSMQFDGRFVVEVKGNQFPRQDDPAGVPSSFWVKGANAPFPLPCEDVFMPGETITIKVRPSHVNNPAYGNIAGLVRNNGASASAYAFDPTKGGDANNPAPVGPYPFTQGQWDGHEGIADPTLSGDTANTSDRITRIANGALIIGFLGYRILPPPGMY